MRQSPYLLTVVLLALVAAAPVRGQLRVAPVAEAPGHVALGLALRRLTEVGSVMMTTAHPDDENNALLAKLRFGEGRRVSLVSATRGDGGQNEIGPELFDALAVLRTEELLAAHRIDGAEQYFTRAVDFGYSFSIEETFEKWGKEEIVGDYVRLIRTLRPDVVIGFIWGGDGGGQHHQASTKLTAEAFRAAADPARFPEQLAQGLRPWQPRKFYYSAGFRAPIESSPKLLPVDLGGFDPLIGKTWAELGGEARSMHKCQGVAQTLPLPGRSVRGYHLHDVALPGNAISRGAQSAADQGALPNASLLDGVDTRLIAVGRYAKEAPPALQRSLEAIERAGREAQQAFARSGPAATLSPLIDGLSALRKLRGALETMVRNEDARYEIDFRLADEERDFEEAVRLASGLRIDALADDGLVVPGQPVTVSVHVAAHGPREVQVRRIQLTGLDAPASACPSGRSSASAVYTCETEARVPADARETRPYWRRLPEAARYEFDPDAAFGLPFQPTPFSAQVTLAVGGATLSLDLPIEYRYQGNIFSGEKRSQLLVVPALSVRVAPSIAIVPVGSSAEATDGNGGGRAGSLSRAIRVDVVNGTKREARAEVRLEAPEGWQVEPASLPIQLAREDEAVSGRFTVTPPPGVKPGHYEIRAVATNDQAEFREGYQVIEYPHIRRRHVYHAAAAAVHVLDIAPLTNLRVGYVMGVGDQVPSAIEQLGAAVTQLQPDDLAWADLDRFDVIVTGVRAYERRDDLRAYNHRLLEWVRRGGTLLVQYNKREFNQAQYAPWPAEVSSDRVTDEDAPVRILTPDHAVFTTPNRITEATWQGWVQERGLYFLGARDSRYVDLIETEDPFPFNSGPKRGALVEARYGKGRWVYIGLGLWRQLPAGTDGAYAMLGNLLALATPQR